tara:strand:- start:168 stop:1241 length:1074 start_codon:yes stop_codon:yes gene_type:complete
MVDASGNRSTDSQFCYGKHTLQERFLASYGASTKKTIIQVYPHERDTRLKDELPTNHPANKKRRRKSQQTVTTVAFHRDGRKYLALSMRESCVQNIWSIMEMPTIIMKANAGTAKATSATKTHELNDDTNHDQPPPRRSAYKTEKGPYPEVGGKNDLKLGYAAQTKFTPYAHPGYESTQSSEWVPKQFEVTKDVVRTTREAERALRRPQPLEQRTLGLITIYIQGYEYTDILRATTDFKSDLTDNFTKELPTSCQTDENLSILRSYIAGQAHYARKASEEMGRLKDEAKAISKTSAGAPGGPSTGKHGLISTTASTGSPTTPTKKLRHRRHQAQEGAGRPTLVHPEGVPTIYPGKPP